MVDAFERLGQYFDPAFIHSVLPDAVKFGKGADNETVGTHGKGCNIALCHS